MSWLSHFTGWVGEKKGAILPIVTGLAGFAAGMIPGIGGALEKKLDKWGSKLSGANDALNSMNQAADVTSPLSPIITAVQEPSSPTTVNAVDMGTAQNTRNPPAPAKSNTPLLIGGGLLALLLLGGNRR